MPGLAFFVTELEVFSARNQNAFSTVYSAFPAIYYASSALESDISSLYYRSIMTYALHNRLSTSRSRSAFFTTHSGICIIDSLSDPCSIALLWIITLKKYHAFYPKKAYLSKLQLSYLYSVTRSWNVLSSKWSWELALVYLGKHRKSNSQLDERRKGSNKRLSNIIICIHDCDNPRKVV